MTNSYALVTGASSGMGYCYARELARRGYNLVIVSNEAEIHNKAGILRADFPGIQVVSLERNLAAQAAASELFGYCSEQGLEVEVLVNNAGVYHDRDFLDDSEGFNKLITMLHVYTPTMLCYYFGGAMASRGKGYILNVCSVTASINVQRLATYSSSKAYLTAFTRCLHIELKSKGVVVTDVSPGAVDTGLYSIPSWVTALGKAFGIIVSPEYLVRRGLRAMFRGRARVIVPFTWRLILVLIALIPTCLLRLIRRLKIY